jgi:multiple sugar transport system permease protein
LALLAIMFLFPFYWAAVSSVRPELGMLSTPVEYWPREFTLENYKLLARTLSFRKFFLNSLIVGGLTTVLCLSIAIGAAYSLARFRFRGRNVFRLSFLITYLFPPILLLVPLFIIIRSLGLLNTYWGLMLAYSTYNLPFATWMLISYFQALPAELEDAAMVDGCTRVGAFLRVLLPLAAPGVAAAAIFIFIYAWNEYLLAMMFTTSPDVRTLPVGLSMFLADEHQTMWGALSAGVVVSCLPAAVLFTFIQRQLVRGLTAGALK